MNETKHLYTEFAPNMTKEHVDIAVETLIRPWRWKEAIYGESYRDVESWLRSYYGITHAYTIDSGRSAMALSLAVLGVGAGDEVILQAYTCVVVPNAIRAVGATPVYVDIQENLTINPDELKRHITPRTKAIIVQHTFGVASDMRAIMAIAREAHIPVIEDAAHALGSTYDGQKLGTIGDVGILSFGRDKVVSCVRGGAIVTTRDDIGQKICSKVKALPFMPLSALITHLLYLPMMAIGIRTYHRGVGKWLLLALKLLHLTSRSIIAAEKQGRHDRRYPARLPDILARILTTELRDFEKNIAHRKTIARIYRREITDPRIRHHIENDEHISNASLLRYTLLVPSPANVHAAARQIGIQLGSWYDTPVAPRDTDLGAIGYTVGSCPVAEACARQSINLPTDWHVTEKDAVRIAAVVTAACRT